MANQLILDRALDANGYVAPGALATIYQAGTLTTQAVYSDEAATITAANPIVADANGFWPQRYVNSPAKAVVTDAASAALYTLDPVPVSSSSSSAASAVSFTPTVALPFNNVQAAVEGAAAASAAGFAAFGIGITGNATLLANLDATGTGAGVYRFDGTTTGTFPSGILASDTGLVSIWRQASNTAMMEISAPSMGTRTFRRRLSGGVWAAWREQVIVDQGATDGDTIYRTAGNWTRLAKGTAGQALVMNAGATAPEWSFGPVGVGQTWQNMLASRAGGTSYQNLTGRPIVVSVRVGATGSGRDLQVSTDNATWVTVMTSSTIEIYQQTAIVPPNHYYRILTGSIGTWAELR